ARTMAVHPRIVLQRLPPPPPPPLFPYTTLFRSAASSWAVSYAVSRRKRPAARWKTSRAFRMFCSDFSFIPASSRSRPAWELAGRSEEHTSELQSRFDLVCRLLLEKKNILDALYV